MYRFWSWRLFVALSIFLHSPICSSERGSIHFRYMHSITHVSVKLQFFSISSQLQTTPSCGTRKELQRRHTTTISSSVAGPPGALLPQPCLKMQAFCYWSVVAHHSIIQTSRCSRLSELLSLTCLRPHHLSVSYQRMASLTHVLVSLAVEVLSTPVSTHVPTPNTLG